MRIIQILVMLLASTPALADEWVCVAEQSIGYEYSTESGEWVGSKFETDKKYLISEASGSDYTYWIAIVGSKNILAVCEEDFGTVGVKKDILTCSDWMVHFQFNRETGRFMYSYLIGFIQGKDDGSSTPTMEIGTCTALKPRYW